MSYAPIHRFPNPISVAVGLAKGYTLYRTLIHEAVRKISLDGQILDIGGKSASSLYFKYMQTAPGSQIICTDLKAAPGVLALDVTKPFPISDDSIDVVIAFNLFEHVFEYEFAFREIYRILKPDGRIYLCVPFLHEFHPAPDDYFRFTASGLTQICLNSGMRVDVISSLYDGILTFALTKITSQLFPRLVCRIVNPLIYLLFFGFERLVSLRPKVNNLSLPQRFAIGYLASFVKSK
jgi:SAM-dependent methyltransferase